jgi:hypothetical protein
MALDTKAWMKSVGFTDEKIAQLLPEMEPFAEGIEKTVLMRSDHSRELDKLRAAEKELQAANERLTTDMAEWASLTAAEKAKQGDFRKEIDEGKEEIFRLRTKLSRLAEDNGVDPKTLLGDAPIVDPKTVVPPAVNVDEIRGQIGGVANYMLSLTADIDDIAREHEELTGQRFNRREFIAGIKADLAKGKMDNLDPVKRWEAANNIPTLRTEKTTATRKAEIDAAREEGRTAGLSEAALPNTSPRQGQHSPVLRLSPNGENKAGRPNPMDRMSGARSALATGKYRSKTA